MKRKQTEASQEFLEQVNTEGGKLDTETLSRALLRAAELVIEEREQSHRGVLQRWSTPALPFGEVRRNSKLQLLPVGSGITCVAPL